MSAPRVVVFAYSDIGHASLEVLLRRGVNIVTVYTHADRPAEHIWFPSVGKLAHDAGIPVRLDADLKSPEGLAAFRALKPDLVLSFYYRDMVPMEALESARLGAYNMHGSLLPKYRGRAPVNWAVALGEKETGATLHVMTRLADAGEIVDQEKVPIGPDDTAREVQERVRDAAVRILERTLDALLAGTAPKKAQDNNAATKFGRRRREDGEIDWSRPAGDIHNLVRAVSHPYPGAFVKVGGSTLTIWRTARGAAPASDGAVKPGTIAVEGAHVFVTAGDRRRLEILAAQLDDGPELEGPALAQRLSTISSAP